MLFVFYVISLIYEICIHLLYLPSATKASGEKGRAFNRHVCVYKNYHFHVSEFELLNYWFLALL